MFNRKSDQTEKPAVVIGQPQLLHTTYDDQDIIPQWQGLSASAAPSEYFQRPIKQSPARLSRNRASGDRELSANLNKALAARGSESPEMAPGSSMPQLPNPLGYHRKPLPLRPEEEAIQPVETVVSVPDEIKSSEAKSRKVSLHKGIPLLQNQVAKLRQTFESNNAQGSASDKKEPRRASGAGPAPIKTRTWEKRIVSAPQYEVTVSSNASANASDEPSKSKKPSWTSRIRKDTFDTRNWRSSGTSSLNTIAATGTATTTTIEPIQATPIEVKRVSQPTLRLVVAETRESEEVTHVSPAEETPARAPTPLVPQELFTPSPVSALGGRFEEHLDEVQRNDSTMDSNLSEVSPVVTPTSITFSMDEQKIARKPVGNRMSLIKRLSMSRKKDKTNAPVEVTADTEKALPPLLPQLSNDEREVSRISWTTVNTNTTAQVDSPPPSPPCDIPDMPPIIYEKPREKVRTPPTPPMESSDERSRSVTPEPMTRYDSMMAKELELKARHYEIESSMRQLLKVDQASPLEVDWRTRRDNKKQLDSARAELAEVERKQHELGLRIARFSVKEAEGNGMEPSLWVRRVTS